jgi:hypothetical protein
MTPRVAENRVGKTERVVVAQEYAVRPVFHAVDDYTDKDEPITICSRILSVYDPLLRYDHATAFGRPCRRCFVVGDTR